MAHVICPKWRKWDKEMTPYDEVKRFDVANFDKEHTDTIEQAKQVAKEQKVEEEAKQIKKKNISKEDTKQSETQQTDNQGNPLNADGTLKLEKIASVDEWTDEDFSAPTRNVELPKLPKNVDDAIGQMENLLLSRRISLRRIGRHINFHLPKVAQY